MKFSERWLRTLVDPPLDTAALCDAADDGGARGRGRRAGRAAVHRCRRGPHRARRAASECRSPARVHRRRGRFRRRCRSSAARPTPPPGMKVPLRAWSARGFPAALAIRQSRRCAASNRPACCARRRSSGYRDDAAGLLRAAGDAPVGADLRAALALDDTLITLKVTPNRADCLSMVGIARDVAAADRRAARAARHRRDAGRRRRARRDVRVEEPAGCPRFVSRDDRRHRSARRRRRRG